MFHTNDSIDTSSNRPNELGVRAISESERALDDDTQKRLKEVEDKAREAVDKAEKAGEKAKEVNYIVFVVVIILIVMVGGLFLNSFYFKQSSNYNLYNELSRQHRLIIDQTIEINNLKNELAIFKKDFEFLKTINYLK